MSWLSCEELSLHVETGDLIEFRAKCFGIFRRKRYLRVVHINHEDSHLPLVDQIQVTEVTGPTSRVRFTCETTQPLSELMRGGKVGHFLNKVITVKEGKKSIFKKISGFFNRIIDNISDFFSTISAKIQEFHEEKLSKLGHTFRRFGYHLCVFIFEAILGILIITCIIGALFIIFWWFSLAFACIMAIVAPGAPLYFPLTLIF